MKGVSCPLTDPGHFGYPCIAVQPLGDRMQFDQLKRREFITFLGCAAAAWPPAARGQQPERMRRLGVLMGWAADDPRTQADLAAFTQKLKELGWADGRNVSAGTRHLMGFSPVQLRDRRVDLSFPRLSRPKLPACSLLSMTGAAGGADAPSLTFAARAGALVERPGRGNALRGGPNQRVWASAVGWRLRTREFPLPLPTRCSACGKRKPEVDGARWVIVSAAGDHPTKR